MSLKESVRERRQLRGKGSQGTATSEIFTVLPEKRELKRGFYLPRVI